MIAFILNLPITVVGMLTAVVSLPKNIEFVAERPYTFVISTTSFWWVQRYASKARAATIGHVVLLGPKVKLGDREHELVHVEQHARAPLIYPLLYTTELLRYGYRNNRYEIEAYERARNEYSGDEALTRAD